MKTLHFTIGFPVSFEINIPMELYQRAKNGDKDALREIREVSEQKGSEVIDIEESCGVIVSCPELEELQD